MDGGEGRLTRRDRDGMPGERHPSPPDRQHPIACRVNVSGPVFLGRGVFSTPPDSRRGPVETHKRFQPPTQPEASGAPLRAFLWTLRTFSIQGEGEHLPPKFFLTLPELALGEVQKLNKAGIVGRGTTGDPVAGLFNQVNGCGEGPKRRLARMKGGGGGGCVGHGGVPLRVVWGQDRGPWGDSHR